MTKEFDLSLLVNTNPTYDVKLPSGIVVTLDKPRAKDTRTLSISDEKTIQQYIRSEHKFKDLTISDSEYLTLAIYSHENKEWVLSFQCENCIENKDEDDEDTLVFGSYNFDDVTVTESPNNHIETTGLTLVLREPTLDEFSKHDITTKIGIDDITKVILTGVIKDGTLYSVSPYVASEIVDNIFDTYRPKVGLYLNNTPQITVDVPVTCPNCGISEVHKPTTLMGLTI